MIAEFMADLERYGNAIVSRNSYQAVRSDFKAYLQRRYPHNNHIGSTVSMAFFSLRHGADLGGLNFADLLSGATPPDRYKAALEAYFASRGRINPTSDASTYGNALMLFREYLKSDDAADPPQPGIIDPPPPPAENPVATPSIEVVMRFLAQWYALPNYTAQERALSQLFHETYPLNTDLRHVLVKCSVLNDFYGTKIFGVFPIARHIVDLQIDDRLYAGDQTLVDDIARVEVRRNYSFATKYCSHHQPQQFPIYDSYVAKMLDYFRRRDGFMAFARDNLQDYPIFCEAIYAFRTHYGLGEFSIKEIDRYLWQLGKEHF
ncbi:MAG: hypothetical protein LBO03_09795 [Acidaminococcales bacterium]|jgi:hypothetical protein|nr:hypothetical protein [Acidaminococcales bacterium]